MKNSVKVDFTLYTTGKGLWSLAKRPVKVHRLEVIDHSEYSFDGAELRVHFTRKSWDRSRYGLIYTDPGFLNDLKAALRARFGLVSNIGYSEHGMQGTAFVSLDVSPTFIKSWRKHIGNVVPKEPKNFALRKVNKSDMLGLPNPAPQTGPFFSPYEVNIIKDVGTRVEAAMDDALAYHFSKSLMAMGYWDRACHAVRDAAAAQVKVILGVNPDDVVKSRR